MQKSKGTFSKYVGATQPTQTYTLATTIKTGYGVLLIGKNEATALMGIGSSGIFIPKNLASTNFYIFAKFATYLVHYPNSPFSVFLLL